MENFAVQRVDNVAYSILKVGGFLDAHTAPQLEDAIQNLVDENRCKIIVSFTDLKYISSAGLGKLSNMTPKIFRVFDLLGFPTLYDIFDDEDEAIEKF